MNRTQKITTLLAVLACITQSAVAGWPDNGVPIAIVPNNQSGPVAVPDGAGGAILVWSDQRTIGTTGTDVYARRITADGTPMWTNNGVAIRALPGSDSSPIAISDGFGGALIVWTQSTDDDIYVQRIDSNGTSMWTANGIKLTGTGFQSSPALVGDGSGGAIVVWYSGGDIHARHINSAGSDAWVPAEVAIVAKPGIQHQAGIVSDGAGGAIVCWSDSTNATNKYDIFAQRVGTTGTLAWTAAGVPICEMVKYQVQPRIFNDGAGGAIITWLDNYPNVDTDIIMQRVDGNGVVKWQTNGVPVTIAQKTQDGPAFARYVDRFIIAWNDARSDNNYDVYAQQFNLSNGQPTWLPDGVPVCSLPSSQRNTRVSADGKGGAMIAWRDDRNDSGDIYVQHLNVVGNILWKPGGEIVVDATNIQVPGGMTEDGNGGVIIPWSDSRNGDADIYATRIGPFGPITTGVRDMPTATLSSRPNYPNPFSTSSQIEVELPVESDIALQVFDVNGRRVRDERIVTRGAGWNRIDVNALDQNGRALPSGVYFVKIAAARASATRKITIAR